MIWSAAFFPEVMRREKPRSTWSTSSTAPVSSRRAICFSESSAASAMKYPEAVKRSTSSRLARVRSAS